MRRTLLLLPLLVAASSPPHAELAAPTPVFVPERFFVGRTEGTGTLKVTLHKAQAVRVRSQGRVEDQVLVLDQVVERTGTPPERRQWRIRKAAGGRITGTVSDGTGPVEGDLSGNRLHLRYKLKKDKVDVAQWIYLQPGGQVALNRMTLRRFGLKVGTLDETIRRLD